MTPHIQSSMSKKFPIVMSDKRGNYERVAHPDNNKEPGVRTDRRLGDASSIHASRVLHRGRGPNYCARAQRWEDVHPRHEWRRDHTVCQRIEDRIDIDLWHKRIGHVNYQRLQNLQLKQVVFGLPNSMAGRPKFVKATTLGSNMDFNSSTNEIRAETGSIWSIQMYGDQHKM